MPREINNTNSLAYASGYFFNGLGSENENLPGYVVFCPGRPVRFSILHLLGIDHEQLTFHTAGRDYRLTDVNGWVVRDVRA